MKKIIFLLAVTFTALISCESNDLPTDYPDSGWLDFTTSSSESADSVGSKDVEIAVNLGNNIEGQTVTFSVELVSGNASDVSKFGVFTSDIEAGNKIGFLTVPISQTDQDGYEALVTILSSSGNYEAGLEDGSKIFEHTINVCQDNKLDIITSETLAGVTFVGGQALFNPQITQVNSSTYYSADIWGGLLGRLGAPFNPPYAGTLTINEDLTLDFVSDTTVPGYDEANSAGGTGIYDACIGAYVLELNSQYFADPVTVLLVSL